MTNNNHKYIVWGIRILVSALFLLSAIAKLYDTPSVAIAGFETKFLGPMGITGVFAQVMSRLLIGLEFSIAVLLLLPYYVKKVVFPATIGLLLIFTIHLIYELISGKGGNCGCMGELIPMSHEVSIVKNVITITLLILPLTKFRSGLEEKKNIHPIFHIGLTISLLMFILLPPGGGQVTGENVEGATTRYDQYFEDLGKGNKLVCFFSPTCEHCQATGKKLTELKQKYPGLIPEIKIMFLDESVEQNGSPDEVAKYFEIIGQTYDYKVLPTLEFMDVFWNGDNDVPGVVYLQEGEEKLFFQGIHEQEFDADKLLEEIKREY